MPELFRRVEKRHACNRFRAVRVCCGVVPTVGWTTLRDVSHQGIALFGQQRFEPGTVLTVEIPRGKRLRPLTLRAEVCYVRALPGGRWVTGCYLRRPLAAEDLLALL